MFFFFNDTATTEIYTLSLHDALPISRLEPVLRVGIRDEHDRARRVPLGEAREHVLGGLDPLLRDRKSTRLNSSHLVISYAVFCLKKKKIVTERLESSRYLAAHLQVTS